MSSTTLQQKTEALLEQVAKTRELADSAGLTPTVELMDVTTYVVTQQQEAIKQLAVEYVAEKGMPYSFKTRLMIAAINICVFLTFFNVVINGGKLDLNLGPIGTLIFLAIGFLGVLTTMGSTANARFFVQKPKAKE